jgi:transposase InsO family protein
MALIDRQYLTRTYYGSRRMAAWLATQGHIVNRKRVQRLMRLLGLVAIDQRPNTSKPAAAHKVYRYLGTLRLNTLVTATNLDDQITIATRPTPMQTKAFELLGIPAPPPTASDKAAHRTR